MSGMHNPLNKTETRGAIMILKSVIDAAEKRHEMVVSVDALRRVLKGLEESK